MTATVTAGERAARDILTRARQRCDPVLRAAVATLPQPLRLMTGYHLGWWDTSGTPVTADSGKAMRPALVVAAASACGVDSDAVLSAAAAVELVHNFTLLHDDVMDGDRTRRGRPTVWSVWGVPSAIVVGDAVHALAIQVLADGPLAATAVATVAAAVDRLECAIIEVCAGQAEDCLFESRPPVDVDQCLRMISRKAGALIGCCCALGALAAGATPTVVAAMDQFGRDLGIAFQFVDDLLGIWGDPLVTGKPAAADLARRKQSLPVVAALNSRSAAGAELASLYRSTGPLTPEQVARAAELVQDAGGRSWAGQQARELAAAAIGHLPDPSAAADLRTLAKFVIDRNR